MTPLDVALLLLATMAVWALGAFIIYPVLLRCGVEAKAAYFWASVWCISPFLAPLFVVFGLFDWYTSWVQRRFEK